MGSSENQVAIISPGVKNATPLGAVRNCHHDRSGTSLSKLIERNTNELVEGDLYIVRIQAPGRIQKQG